MLLLANVVLEYDKPSAKRLFQEAVGVYKASKDSDAEESEMRSLVDLAYQLDPDMAATLASELDVDRGRLEARKRIQFQKLKERLMEPTEAVVESEPVNAKDLAAVCWDLLGQLNADRINTRDVGSSIALLRQIRDTSFENAFPVFSFLIQNAVARRGQADEAKIYLRDVFEATLRICEVAQAVVQRTAGRAISSSRGQSHKGRMLIAAGERQKALDVIAEWIRTSEGEQVFICDPFFGPRDLEILQLVKENRPELTVIVVTSRKQQEHDAVTFPYEDFYSSYWSRNFSQQSPPATEIVVVGGPAGELPIHDRWILGEKAGLRLGTSLNGLGVTKDSELTPLTEAEVKERLEETNSYVQRFKKEHLGHRLTYSFFQLT